MNEIMEQTERAVRDLLAVAKLEPGDLFVVGCSSSEVQNQHIGKGSSEEIGTAIYETIARVLGEHHIYLAAQCCEHLNRALVVEAEVAKRERYEIVNAVPHPKAGGSFATAAYKGMKQPVLVESIRAKAGIDIGQTLIGMHLQAVAVPVRLEVKQIGSAIFTAARTRPRSIGGERAWYDEKLN